MLAFAHKKRSHGLLTGWGMSGPVQSPFPQPHSQYNYIGHVPRSVSINYLVSVLELRNDTVPSSLREPWGVFACSFLQGGRGKTVVCNFVPLGPCLCFLMCALGLQVLRLGAQGDAQ